MNIEIEDDDDEEQVQRCNEPSEQLEVFVGFYRPGEYRRETTEDDDDASEASDKSNAQKKDEQVRVGHCSGHLFHDRNYFV